MRIGNGAHTYATQANAIKALTAALARIGRTLDDTRWFIAASTSGPRFYPVVVAAGKDTANLIPLAFLNIVVVG